MTQHAAAPAAPEVHWRALDCTRVEGAPYKRHSTLFTAGRRYVVLEVGPGNLLTVRDDLGWPRCLCVEHGHAQFIVGHDAGGFPLYAHFDGVPVPA